MSYNHYVLRLVKARKRLANGKTVQEVIADVIRDRGAIPFERFMDMALYYPGKGYYSASDNRVGRKGDFYTSPHLHQMFGAVLGRQIEECWTLLERPKDFIVVEQGAGRGYLALDMLDSLKGRDCYENLRYFIIELNSHEVRSQKYLLREHADRVRWVSTLDEIGHFVGCYLSNELVDAFPVHVVQMEKGLQEIFVDIRGEKFVEVLREPSTDELKAYLELHGVSLSTGYRTEINLRVGPWINAIAQMMKEGFVITIDYGYDARDYYREERNRGTLLCYYRHQVREDSYENIGEQDITAHVNFSDIKKRGEESGFRTLGYGTQGTYLVSMGLDEIIMEKYDLDEREPDENYQFEMAKIKGLIAPGGMGESHKVMVQYKGEKEFPLRGFLIRNRIHLL